MPRPSEGHTVLIGSAGAGAAFGTIKSIREQWKNSVRIIAVDINPPHLVAASGFADIYEQVPPSSADEYPHCLRDLLNRYSVDTYFPILDHEIVLAAKLRDDSFFAAGLVVLAPALRAAQICIDKLASAEWLKENLLPAPYTALPECYEWRRSGAFLKPRKGYGSMGARRIANPSELLTASEAAETLVAQEVCTKPEITIDAFRSARIEYFRAVCRERIETKAGVCTKARVFEDRDLTRLAEKIGEGLGLTGTFCLQVMRREDSGQWLITDINTRPGAGTRICAALGVDFLAANLAEAWGMDATHLLPRLQGEHFVVRQYMEYAMT